MHSCKIPLFVYILALCDVFVGYFSKNCPIIGSRIPWAADLFKTLIHDPTAWKTEFNVK